MENLFFTLILFVILGGFISWKYISNKEKRCIKESKTMGDTSWTPQLEEWTKFVSLSLGLLEIGCIVRLRS